MVGLIGTQMQTARRQIGGTFIQCSPEREALVVAWRSTLVEKGCGDGTTEDREISSDEGPMNHRRGATMPADCSHAQTTPTHMHSHEDKRASSWRHGAAVLWGGTFPPQTSV